MKKEYCIMPENPHYKTERFYGSHRHEVFYGIDRQNSIKYGLVVFLKPEFHNMSDRGVHFNKPFDLYLKKIAQKTAMEYYKWDTKEWLKHFSKNYI